MRTASVRRGEESTFQISADDCRLKLDVTRSRRHIRNLTRLDVPVILDLSSKAPRSGLCDSLSG